MHLLFLLLMLALPFVCLGCTSLPCNPGDPIPTASPEDVAAFRRQGDRRFRQDLRDFEERQETWEQQNELRQQEAQRLERLRQLRLGLPNFNGIPWSEFDDFGNRIQRQPVVRPRRTQERARVVAEELNNLERQSNPAADDLLIEEKWDFLIGKNIEATDAAIQALSPAPGSKLETAQLRWKSFENTGPEDKKILFAAISSNESIQTALTGFRSKNVRQQVQVVNNLEDSERRLSAELGSGSFSTGRQLLNIR